MNVYLLAKGCGNGIATSRITNLLIFLLLSFSFNIGISNAQTSSLQFSPISTWEDIIAPGRGAEQWHNGSMAISNPADNNNQASLDVYYRFTWNKLENRQGDYRWEYFDDLVRNAIDKGQKFSFGIMSCYPQGSGSPGVLEYDNGNSAYPEYLHWLMQGESNSDWKTNGYGSTTGYGTWVPNWNSPNYLSRLRALHEALYAHINSTYYTANKGPNAGKTIAFKNAIFSIDIRGYGAWGEWHSASIVNHVQNYPSGRAATTATLKKIIDHHADVFTNHPLSLMISVFDGERLFNTFTPKEVGAYALQRTNNWGLFGWRRDNWGATDKYLDTYLRDNLNFFGNSGPFNAQIMERWKYAPITGEPPGWASSLLGCFYDDLERQLREYHATSMGNGNFGVSNLAECAKQNIRSAFRAAGYRIVLESGSMTRDVKAGANLTISLNWKNIGIAPTYEDWNVVFELRNGSNNVVWSGNSSFSPGRKGSTLPLLPSSQAKQVTDYFTLPSNIPQGDYRLCLVIKDPSNYRAPFPLAIQGRNTDGSYTLKNIFVASSGGTNTPQAPTTPPPAPPASSPGSCPTINASIGTTGGCNGSQVNLVLESANGQGPFDIVVNGTTYNNISVGSAFTSLSTETIWTGRPSFVTDIDRPVEVGVKFVSSENGYIRGIRFYSPNSVAGSYTGHLWSGSGTLLGIVEFYNVTRNGWQEALFAQPIAISEGATYIASYYTSAGIYASTIGGLTNAVSNGESLTALGNSTKGGNGVYKYNGSGFPTSSYQASNYWVDVLFSKNSSVFNFTSITDNNGCKKTGSIQTLVVSSQPCTQQRSSSGEVMVKAAPLISKEEEHINELRQNYPNPFNDVTVISYRLARAGKINLSLYDMNGKLLKVMVNASKEAGEHTATLRAGELAAGVYFYRLQGENYSAVKKMIIH